MSVTNKWLLQNSFKSPKGLLWALSSLIRGVALLTSRWREGASPEPLGRGKAPPATSCGGAASPTTSRRRGEELAPSRRSGASPAPSRRRGTPRAWATVPTVWRFLWSSNFLFDEKDSEQVAQINLTGQFSRQCRALATSLLNLFPQSLSHSKGKMSGLLRKKALLARLLKDRMSSATNYTLGICSGGVSYYRSA